MSTEKRTTPKPSARTGQAPRSVKMRDPSRAFRERLRLLVRGFGSAAAFARHCGIQQARVSEWLAGEQMPNAGLLSLICDRTGVSADWLLMGRGGQSVVPWTASRSREELEQDLAIHVHAHICKRDKDGAFDVLDGHRVTTDWLVDGCGLMSALLEAEEKRIRDWAIWEQKIDSLLHVSDDIVETLKAIVPLLPEQDDAIGAHVHQLGQAAITALSITDVLDAPPAPNCWRRIKARVSFRSQAGPKLALKRLLNRLKRTSKKAIQPSFRFSSTGKLVVAPVDALKP